MIALDKVLCQHWNTTSDEGVDGIYREENWGWLINDNCPEEKKVAKNSIHLHCRMYCNTNMNK